MAEFGTVSAENLSQCTHSIQRVFNEVVKRRDCSVICGRRDEAEQTRAYSRGVSKAPWPESKHNVVPPELSKAVDVIPYPEGFGDPADEASIKRSQKAFKELAETVFEVCIDLGEALYWGGFFRSMYSHNTSQDGDKPHWEERS